MDEARRLFAEHGGIPVVAAASHQRSGRGRIASRTWADADNGSLLFTVALPISSLGASVSEIPLRTGAGVALFIESLMSSHSVLIKWPNDILIEGSKVCGILCESSSDAVYIGVGLNCVKKELTVEEGKFPPGFLSQYGVAVEDPLRLLEGLLISISRRLISSTWRDDVSRRLYRRGELISFYSGQADAGEIITGILAGIDQYGGIMIEDENRHTFRTLYAGEIRA
jgi:BirA family biotin operon repressor/biotin-[acetyl-CoA-carboxylase] ligase